MYVQVLSKTPTRVGVLWGLKTEKSETKPKQANSCVWGLGRGGLPGHCAQAWLLQGGGGRAPAPQQSCRPQYLSSCISPTVCQRQDFLSSLCHPTSCTGGKLVPHTAPSVQGCCCMRLQCQWLLLGFNPSALRLCSRVEPYKQKTTQSCQKMWYLCCSPEGRVALQAAGQWCLLWREAVSLGGVWILPHTSYSAGLLVQIYLLHGFLANYF